MNPRPTTPTIRELRATDSIASLTHLIHESYASHAALGLRYWGTHQTEEDTAKRYAMGVGLVAEFEGAFVGTLTLRRPQPASPLILYRNPGVWSLSQFAVAPQFKRQGLGWALHEAAEEIAIHRGAVILALDTATPAAALIEMYKSWGYAVVGEHDWRPHTNYVSTVMSRSVSALPVRVP